MATRYLLQKIVGQNQVGVKQFPIIVIIILIIKIIITIIILSLHFVSDVLGTVTPQFSTPGYYLELGIQGGWYSEIKCLGLKLGMVLQL
jgi:hypothetical protein